MSPSNKRDVTQLRLYTDDYPGVLHRAGFLARCGVCSEWHDINHTSKKQAVRTLKDWGWRFFDEHIGWVCRGCLAAHGHIDDDGDIPRTSELAVQRSRKERT